MKTPRIQILAPPQGEPPRPNLDPDILAGHLSDASSLPGGRAIGILRARSADEIASFMRHTSGSGTHVLPIGSQSSLTGASVPMNDLIVCTNGLDRVEPVEEQSETSARVRAGAGVLLRDLQAHVGRVGWFYPPVPTYDLACLGGTIATNAAGSATFKYGSTRSWVSWMRVVLESGWIVDIPRGACVATPGSTVTLPLPDGGRIDVPIPSYQGPAVKKASMGYSGGNAIDLIDLFIGSEGTLGIIVEAEVELVRVPPMVLGVLVFVDEETRAVDLVAELRSMSRATWNSGDLEGIDVRAIEHLDGASLDLLRRSGVMQRLKAPIPPDARMCLIMELELKRKIDDREIQDQFEAAFTRRDHAPSGGISSFLELVGRFNLLDRIELALPSDPGSLSRLKELREAVPATVNEIVREMQREKDPRISKLAGDMCVPFEHFAESLEVYRSAFETRGLDHVIFGHISDGNVHPNVIARSHEQYLAGQQALLEVADWVQSIGGSPLAEHGVGRNPIKKQLLERYYGHAAIEEMRQVKRAFDPEGRLARGVLFDMKEPIVRS